MAYQAEADFVLGKIIAANMNSVADQAIAIGASSYVIEKIIVTNGSASLTLAAGGVYTATSKGGTAVVAAGQLYSALTTAVKVLNLTLANTDLRSEAVLYLALTVAQGTAATADVYIVGYALSG